MKDYLEKRREELSKREEGFTLMEMLIVVAIIAVLIAIAIPIFTTQLERSREATDAANIRSAYAEVSASYLTDGGTHHAGVKKQQTKEGWETTINWPSGLSVPNHGDWGWDVSIDTQGNVTVAAAASEVRNS